MKDVKVIRIVYMVSIFVFTSSIFFVSLLNYAIFDFRDWSEFIASPIGFAMVLCAIIDIIFIIGYFLLNHFFLNKKVEEINKHSR